MDVIWYDVNVYCVWLIEWWWCDGCFVDIEIVWFLIELEWECVV